MTADRHRAAGPNRLPHPRSTGRDSSGHGASARAQRRRVPLVAALAVTALLVSGAYAVAAPAPELTQTDAISASPGATVTVKPHQVFSNTDLAGFNPRFSSVTFSTTEYYESDSGIDASGNLVVKVKSAADLNALSPAPPSPFTVTADVKVTSDRQRNGSGTLSFVTTYARVSDSARPTFIGRGGSVPAPPGVLVSTSLNGWFDNMGTNPRFTAATFSTLEYYTQARIGPDGERLFAQAKSPAELNALESPPPDPFTVTADVTITNDEGGTATGTIPFKTEYSRTPDPVQPTLKAQDAVYAPPGVMVSASLPNYFDNPGTNARFTSFTLSTDEYYHAAGIGGTPGVNDDHLYVQVKTTAELNALDSPPPSPFTVTATVTITNDEGTTATGTISFKTTYVRNPTSGDPSPPETTPTFSGSTPHAAAPGTTHSLDADDWFDDAGTNPKFTAATFSTEEYYTTAEIRDGVLHVQVKTAAELNALDSPPPSPFTVTATVTMSNDEEQTATGLISFETTYDRDPTLAQTEAISAPPGTLVAKSAEEVFDSAGTNPEFTSVSFSTEEYFDADDTGIKSGKLYVKVKTAAELSALESPPDSPFTVTADVTMSNDEGATATGTITFKTSYVRERKEDRDETAPPPTDEAKADPPGEGSESPTFSQTGVISAPPGTLVVKSADDVFDNAGTNPVLTSVSFSTADYYDADDTGIKSGSLHVKVKTAVELNALDSPPDSPFTVKAEVTMSNDEGQTAGGEISFQTSYVRESNEEDDDDDDDGT